MCLCTHVYSLTWFYSTIYDSYYIINGRYVLDIVDFYECDTIRNKRDERVRYGEGDRERQRWSEGGREGMEGQTGTGRHRDGAREGRKNGGREGGRVE